jgi:hypothetical protein
MPMSDFETRRRNGVIAVPNGSGLLWGRKSTDTTADKYLILLKSFGGQAILLHYAAVGQLGDHGYTRQNGLWPGTIG